ncbi:hypothetical protein OVA24_16400 [Luteolibacter sp. SL250]|uniref:hypothetical protein n=1 Tax=Luteolibacter sp. SL250 TaxID=2995170 RepID=UPI00226F021A|nr:hypothetical protein [Luteolibacter sp. SL250]WAC18812.1 hypothetical protein OVA24_16400 [Luteolibacter sp. SL250]
MPYTFEEDDEVMQAYLAEYDLADPAVSTGQRTKILNLTASIRQAKRLDFDGRAKALSAIGNLERRLAEIRVFFPSEHEGYNRLIASHVTALAGLLQRAQEKFPADA